MNDGKIRLNLASGVNILEGFFNLDIAAQWPGIDKKCDMIWDARKDKLQWADNSVEEVYAGFLFLHLAPCFHAPLIADIHRVLRPGGQLWIVEVDMDLVMRRYLENPTDARTCELIWGEQGVWHGQDLADYDKHCHGYTQASLLNFLSNAGFGQFNVFKNSDPVNIYYEVQVKCYKL